MEAAAAVTQMILYIPNYVTVNCGFGLNLFLSLKINVHSYVLYCQLNSSHNIIKLTVLHDVT